MTTIHDNDPGSPIRELERSLMSTQAERDALARRMDELESVLAAGRLGFCRIALGTLDLRANSQFKAEFGWPPDARISWRELLERIQRDDRTKLAEAVSCERHDNNSRQRARFPYARARALLAGDPG